MVDLRLCNVLAASYVLFVRRGERHSDKTKMSRPGPVDPNQGGHWDQDIWGSLWQQQLDRGFLILEPVRIYTFARKFWIPTDRGGGPPEHSSHALIAPVGIGGLSRHGR